MIRARPGQEAALYRLFPVRFVGESGQWEVGKIASAEAEKLPGGIAGAKRIVQIGEGELRATIAEGRYSPATARHLYDVLWQRRQKIARAYFSETPPLDYFRIEAGALCWDDLWMVAGLGDDGEYQADGKTVGARCVAVGDGYRVVELRVRRAAERRWSRPVRVHLSNRRIVGIER